MIKKQNLPLLCKCGCGKLTEFDKKGRQRKYIQGHRKVLKAPISIHDYIQVEHKECLRCNIDKHISEFPKHRRMSKITNEVYYRYESWCSSCINEYNRDFYQTEEGKALKKSRRPSTTKNIKTYIQNRLASWRKSTPGCDLSTDYLLNLYESQKGLCYYTMSPMILPIGGPNPSGISLDKLTPESGYNKGNVAFCTYEVNTMKGRRTESEFYSRMIDILNNKLPNNIVFYEPKE